MTERPVYITQQELAARWKVTVRTLERWRGKRYGPTWITLGGSIRYRMSDVLVWEAAHLTQP